MQSIQGGFQQPVHGPYVDEFEKKVAEYVGAKGAVSCQNGTSGLHIALLCCGVTREDEGYRTGVNIYCSS
ncbi:MAG: DegT/DnrJ/EryC1/StrS family aminotransferase [Bacillota bacterium]